MRTFELTLRSPRSPTEQAGWHLAWPHATAYPYVLWAEPGVTEWRSGAQRVEIDAWAGPLPERKS